MSSLPILPERQRAVLDFIVAYIDQRGISPTQREIATAVGIASTNGVNDHLLALERKGYIEPPLGERISRGIRLTKGARGGFAQHRTNAVPLLAGPCPPSEQTEAHERTLHIDSDLLPTSAVFAVHTTGGNPSLGIFSEDVLFVRRTNVARPTDVVIAGFGETTSVGLRRDVVMPVIGVVVGVYRRLRV